MGYRYLLFAIKSREEPYDVIVMFYELNYIFTVQFVILTPVPATFN